MTHSLKSFLALAFVLVLNAARAADPVISLSLSGGGNPDEGAGSTFQWTVQLDPGSVLKAVGNGSVNDGNSSVINFNPSSVDPLNTVSQDLPSQITYPTAGNYTATVTATVTWTNNATDFVKTVAADIPIVVRNVAPTIPLLYCDKSQTDDFGSYIANPTVQRGVPVVFQSLVYDPGVTTLSTDWDLDEDGNYGEAPQQQNWNPSTSSFSPTATKAFFNSGQHFVKLRVSDAQGGNLTQTFSFTVDNQQPTAVTENATAIGGTKATLNGSTDQKSMVQNSAFFQIGTDVNFGTNATVTLNAADTSVSNTVTGLSKNTGYFYRFCVQDGGGLIVTGQTLSFQTTNGTAPTCVPDSALSNGNGTITIDVLANDSDADASPLALASVSTPAFGTAAIVGGNVTYTPGKGFKGTDSFTYVATNGSFDSQPVTVSISSSKGAFYGLVSLPATGGSSAPTDNGILSLTLSYTGGFTGKLILGSKAYPIKGTFDSLGKAQITIPQKAPASSLVLDLSLVSPGTGLPAIGVDGTITDGTKAYNLALDPVSDPKTLPAEAVGTFTVAIDPPSDSTLPQGYGFGILSIGKKGSAALFGRRPDGEQFIMSAKQAVDGANWVFINGFGPSPKGSVSASVNIGDDGTNDLVGTFSWSKSATTKGLYQPAFSVSLDLVGSKYVVPAKTSPAFEFTTSAPDDLLGSVDLTGTDGSVLSSSPLSAIFNSKDGFAEVINKGSAFKGSIKRKNGTIFGTFYPPGEKIAKFNGIILQRQNAAYGYYSSSNGTGAVVITPQ